MKGSARLAMAAACLFGLFAFGSVRAAEVKVAAVTFHPTDMAHNIPKMVAMASEAAKNGARLIVFPEMAATGYLYIDLAQEGANIDTIPGTATKALGAVAKTYGVYISFGLIERDAASGLVYNAAALVGPKGLVGKYRKNQLQPGFDNLFRSPGNLGFPVFDTEIGKIAMMICYDDSQLQSLLLPALRGADIVAYSVAALYIPKAERGSSSDHSTIASMATLPGWMGINVVGANGSGIDDVAEFDSQFIGPGGSTVWNTQGQVIASAPVTSWNNPAVEGITYADIDTAAPNPQRAFWLKHRRPELYADYNLFKGDFDSAANTVPAQVSALLVQYKPEQGAVEKNAAAIETLIAQQQQGYGLVVLPFNSFIGDAALTAETAKTLAEPIGGKSYTMAQGLAKKFRTYLMFSMPEVAGDKYYETAVLFDYDGKQVGLYRKAHLNDAEQGWATAGNELPVFDTDLGRIAVVLNDEARIPELADMYGLKRANMILVPVAYGEADYGGPVAIPQGLVPDESNRGMFVWYSMAKMSQAFTLVANYVTDKSGDTGRSALYSLVPEEGFFAPRMAPANKDVAYQVNFATNQNVPLWTSQSKKVIERRWDQALPLTLSAGSACFKAWQANSSSATLCQGQD
ncbi:carbon-nitrogen hydrolase family protein [Kaistia algarum]|uniref:carbon-nitrogen hydrolase family protein n=1 Tax=Kaistia algarum TaxID=2083279 RepID=UPI002253A45A|nr:carbon-nitrogen hydrolase family protein [Kaistia algarum]MCX5515756.1 carbon-nitrogen hydrolase family protein [Kaistia algarum]